MYQRSDEMIVYIYYLRNKKIGGPFDLRPTASDVFGTCSGIKRARDYWKDSNM
jgi:hypothetical protein